MALLHQQSAEKMKPELDLFGVQPTQTSVEHGHWVEYNAYSGIKEDGPLEFYITGTGDEYLDLSKTKLHVEAKIVNADGTDLEDGAPVAPVNLLLHSMFKKVDVTMNNKVITPSNNNYPYRAYLETLLTYGKEAKETQLTSALWYKDTAGAMDATAGNNNTGLVARREIAAQSDLIDLTGRLHVDIMFQDKYMLNGIDFNIRLMKNTSAFMLMANGEHPAYRIVITAASLLLWHMKLNDTICGVHARTLAKATAKYPITRVETKVYSVPRGNLDASQDNLFLGQIPKRIVVGCVDNDAYNGSYVKNPFNFKHYHLNYATLYVGGQQIPSVPLQPNFDQNKYIQCYETLFSALGKWTQDEGNHITRAEYANGYTLLGFDLTPDLDDSEHVNLVKKGSVRLELRFAEALPNTINVIVLAEFDNLIEIDRNRQVLFDYSA